MSAQHIHIFSPECHPQRTCALILDRRARRLIGTLWMLSIVVLGYLLSPVAVQSSERNVYELTGELSINGEAFAKPQDTIEEGRDSYILIESERAVIRITYSVQSAGDSLVDARFLIEQAHDEGWQTLMQPSLQAALGQQMSVSFEAEDDADIEEVHFLFTLTERS